MQNLKNAKDQPTKRNPPKQIYQTKFAKPSLPNQTYQKEPPKPNLAKRAYQTNQIKPICICFNSFPVFATIAMHWICDILNTYFPFTITPM